VRLYKWFAYDNINNNSSISNETINIRRRISDFSWFQSFSLFLEKFLFFFCLYNYKVALCYQILCNFSRFFLSERYCLILRYASLPFCPFFFRIHQFSFLFFLFFFFASDFLKLYYTSVIFCGLYKRDGIPAVTLFVFKKINNYIFLLAKHDLLNFWVVCRLKTKQEKKRLIWQRWNTKKYDSHFLCIYFRTFITKLICSEHF